MVKVISGLNIQKNAKCIFYLDGNLKKNLDATKIRVKQKNWDYVAIITGICGVGKSNFSQSVARYCAESFDETYICFTAEQFISVTNRCDEFSAVVLDESFASLNTRVSNSSSFLRIVNHLQLIRQKHLFIFLCLPNFFDLSKGIAIYRSSHLFLIYADSEGNRGRFCAFDRNGKRQLYIKGGKYLNYHAVESNFYGKFTKQKVLDEKIYDGMKMKHLLEQETKGIQSKDKITRDNFIEYLHKESKLTQKQICEIGDICQKTVSNALQRKK